MENADYHPDAVDNMLELFKETFGGRFKAYFNGDPDAIGESYLPCMTFSQTDGDVTDGASGTDDVAETILIRVILNKKDDLNASPDTDLTEYKLRKIIGGQHPTSKEYLPGTVLHTLRTNYTLNDVVVKNRISYSLVDVLRPDEVVTKEALITVEVERMTIVPVRD